MIPEDEYSKLVGAVRISGTLLILSAAWSAWEAASNVLKYGDLFDRTVRGGRTAYPDVTRLVLEGQHILSGSVITLTVVGIVLVCFFKQLPRVVLTVGIAVALLNAHTRLVAKGIGATLPYVRSLDMWSGESPVTAPPASTPSPRPRF